MNQKTSILYYSKNYGSSARETRLKVAVNIADATSLLEKARTLKKCVSILTKIGTEFNT